MNEWYFIIGVFLVLITLVDFIWTTLWIDGGAGPITNRLTTWIWKVMKALSRNKAHGFLSIAGPLILSATVAVWIGLFWIGWTFLFASDPNALTNTQVQAPASWSDRFYFAGYVLFTLGNGSITPSGPFWKTVTVIATANGMLSITLAVTYLLSVVSAAVRKRSFAQSVTGAGMTGIELVKTAWNGENYREINLALQAFSTQLSELTSQHKAYPILHYYHEQKAQKSAVYAVVVLDEALTIFLRGVPAAAQPNTLLMKQVRSSVDGYLEAVKDAHIMPATHTPPVPDIHFLQEHGLPVCSTETFRQSLHELKQRRQILGGIIEESGRKWPA